MKELALSLLKSGLSFLGISWIKAAIIGGGALALFGTIVWYSNHQYNKGWNAHKQLIITNDREIVNDALNGYKRYRACIDSGRVWSQTGNKCTGN